jgi:hypothetical protein
MKISLIHPSRSRPEKSMEATLDWLSYSATDEIEYILSIDSDDLMKNHYEDMYYKRLLDFSHWKFSILTNPNKSSVDAINIAAKETTGEILIVISDDMQSGSSWDVKLLKEVDGKKDWILKTQDSIQDWIITLPILHRDYYNRFGYIYHPDFEHLFCDTYLTCVADITGRKITSNLMFKHLNDTIKDDLRKRTDGTWQQGQDTFIRLMKQFSKADIQKIQDRQMIRFLRNNGVQV